MRIPKETENSEASFMIPSFGPSFHANCQLCWICQMQQSPLQDSDRTNHRLKEDSSRLHDSICALPRTIGDRPPRSIQPLFQRLQHECFAFCPSSGGGGSTLKDDPVLTQCLVDIDPLGPKPKFHLLSIQLLFGERVVEPADVILRNHLEELEFSSSTTSLHTFRKVFRILLVHTKAGGGVQHADQRSAMISSMVRLASAANSGFVSR